MKLFARTSFLFLFTLFINRAFSQSNIDSIRNEVRLHPSNVINLLSLAKGIVYSNPDSSYLIAKNVLSKGNEKYYSQAYELIANHYHKLGQLDSGRYFYLLALKTFPSKNDISTKLSIFTALANLMYFEGKFQNAIDTLTLVSDIIPSLKNEKVKNNYLRLVSLNLAQIYVQIGLTDKAMQAYYELINISQKSKDLEKESSSWEGLGRLYYSIKDYKKSIELYHKTIIITYVTNNLIRRTEAFNMIGYCFLELNKLDSALLYNNMAITILEKEPNANELANSYLLKGAINIKKGNKQDALIEIKNALDIAVKNSLEATRLIAFESMGDAFKALNKFDSAKKYYSEALKFYIANERYTDMSSVYIKMLQSKLLASNDQEALGYLIKLDSAREKSISEEKLKLTTAQEIKYQTSLKEATIIAQKAEIKNRTERNYLLTGLLSLAVILGLFIFITYRKVIIQKDKIDEQNKKIELQKREILHFQKNSLNRLKSIFRRQSENILLQENVKTNEDRLFAVSLLHNLLYGNNNDTNLKEYLEKLCEAKSIQDEISISCIVSQPTKIKSQLLQDIGIISNEIISNSVKHAFGKNEGKHISVNACEDKGFISLHFRDNGSGLPNNFSIEKNLGFGIGYVYDLVKQHNGIIKTYNENGTHFEISLQILHV